MSSLALEEEAEGSADDAEYEVRRLAQGEDLVIDGETAIDDMLVAQRIAEQESFLHAQTFVEDGDGADNGAPTPARPAPSSADMEKLLRLLEQTNKLTTKLGQLPSQFDGVVGEEVRSACRAAAAAVERLAPQRAKEEAPTPAEDADVDRLVEEAAEAAEEAFDGGGADAVRLAQAAALAGLDLASTDEEEEQGVGKVASSAAAAPAAPPRARDDAGARCGGQAPGGERPGQGEGEDEEAEKEDAAAEEKVEPEVNVDPGAPIIRTDTMPEAVPADGEIEHIGELHAVVSGLVVVRGFEKARALDLQSVLCAEDRRVLGVIIDVFGPVAQPHYLVHVTGAGADVAKPGDPIYAATSMPETSYLCDTADAQQLRRLLAGPGEEEDVDASSEEDAVSEQDGEDAEEEPQPAAGARAAQKGGGGRKGKGKGKGGSKGPAASKGSGAPAPAPARSSGGYLEAYSTDVKTEEQEWPQQDWRGWREDRRTESWGGGEWREENSADSSGARRSSEARAGWGASHSSGGAGGETPRGPSTPPPPAPPPPRPPAPPPARTAAPAPAPAQKQAWAPHPPAPPRQGGAAAADRAAQRPAPSRGPSAAAAVGARCAAPRPRQERPGAAGAPPQKRARGGAPQGAPAIGSSSAHGHAGAARPPPPPPPAQPGQWR